jgi:hypothetical protein
MSSAATEPFSQLWMSRHQRFRVWEGNPELVRNEEICCHYCAETSDARPKHVAAAHGDGGGSRDGVAMAISIAFSENHGFEEMFPF